MTAERSRRVLLAYFSRPGENLWYEGHRVLEVGNTEILATMIQERIGCDVFRIVPTEPYPWDYNGTVARNLREQEQDARPAIAGELPDLSAYTTLLLAGPIWNVRPPMVQFSFLDGVDLAGVQVLPVTTHSKSGLGYATEAFTQYLPHTEVGMGISIRGEEVADSGPTLDLWLRGNDLIPR